MANAAHESWKHDSWLVSVGKVLVEIHGNTCYITGSLPAHSLFSGGQGTQYSLYFNRSVACTMSVLLRG